MWSIYGEYVAGVYGSGGWSKKRWVDFHKVTYKGLKNIDLSFFIGHHTEMVRRRLKKASLLVFIAMLDRL